MFLWDSLILGVLLYGVGLWGYKERGEVERLQLKYIKWTLGLDIRTPDYIVLEETKREKIRVRAGRRALSFEEGVREGIGWQLLRECLREKQEGRQKTRSMEEREGYLTRNGWSGLGLVIERRQGRESKEMIENLKRRDIERQGQAQYEKIQRSRYNERYKWIATVGIPEYLSKSGNGESQQLIAQARCGSLERWKKKKGESAIYVKRHLERWSTSRESVGK
ncbi:hypothetical protein WH47_11086 [Habropoda laboriosa]|uniref:Uncharacterized protein n=1 Tax=Habropoda laboriosa TaxID=597456 RepID=A0A0L7QMA2_9HYME|nr:hypothetical protein WH47_11086 [Habropoda laboriosa]